MKWMHTGVVPSTAAMLFALAMTSVHAQLVNGGFETGTFAGWTQTGDTSFTGVDPIAARTGSFGAFFGPTAAGGISQSFATAASTTYRVSFSLALDNSAQPNSFSWSWNGVTQAPSFNNATLFGYTDFSSFVSATGTSSTIAFNFTNPQSFWLLDNVAVTVSAVPEMPVNALLGAGLLLVAAAGKRSARWRTRA
jgi:hypothetical protein